MDDKSCIIIIDDKDKTVSIAKCEKTSSGYDVVFKSNNKKYSYSLNRIQVLPLIGTVDCNDSKVYVNGIHQKNVSRILDYGEWKKLIFENGRILSCKTENMRLEINCLKLRQVAAKLTYLAELAEKISLKTDDGSSILSKHYEGIDFIGEDCALGFYLAPEHEQGKKTLTFPMIFPFGLNPSQKTAVENALTSRFSIIEGPPGTGKTQTILNIIANLIVQDKAIAIVSGNNSATDNVLEKLKNNGFDFICAALGSKDNKSRFIDGQSGRYPDISAWSLSTEDAIQLKSMIRQLVSELDEMLAVQNKIAEIRERLSELKKEKKYFDSYYERVVISSSTSKPKLGTNSDRLLDLWLECEKFAEKSQIPGLWFRIKKAFIYGLESLRFIKQPTDQIIPVLQDIYYGIYQRELEKEQIALNDKLNGYHFQDKMKELRDKSVCLFRAFLAKKYGTNIDRKKFLKDDLWKNHSDFLKEYPVVLSTTYSIRSSLSKNCVFDYVIIDESSQVDIVTGALAFANTRNAVIVGDLMQLPHVVTSEIKKEAASIGSRHNLDSVVKRL